MDIGEKETILETQDHKLVTTLFSILEKEKAEFETRIENSSVKEGDLIVLYKIYLDNTQRLIHGLYLDLIEPVGQVDKTILLETFKTKKVNLEKELIAKLINSCPQVIEFIKPIMIRHAIKHFANTSNNDCYGNYLYEIYDYILKLTNLNNDKHNTKTEKVKRFFRKTDTIRKKW